MYADGLILSPNKTCPRFSDGDLLSSVVQKSKLKEQKNEIINHKWMFDNKIINNLFIS